MFFYGLFIGIDRYRSKGIDDLSCAERDAKALHALFSDNLGSNARLLTNEEATQSNIRSEFYRLKQTKKEDLVVITYSGHGSDTHELVTYDADPLNFSQTAIPLKELHKWFSEIPSEKIILILDCCFSGGIGAKVAESILKPRGESPSVETLLSGLSGKGRLILTASRADEEAFENTKLKHGLLTFYLLEALQGAEEVRTSGNISFFKLLEYVTQRIIDQTKFAGKVQNPCLRGEIDGYITLPVFKPGSEYFKVFPERGNAKVNRDIKSLMHFGFPPTLTDCLSLAIPKLNQLQIDAINDFKLFEGDHLVVSAPTSTGKTMIGELAALKAALERKRSFFLFPLKALVNDKHNHFNRTYGKFGLKIIRATGDCISDIPDLMRGKYDICLMTYEKFSILVLQYPHLLAQVGAIVVDEAQMIVDESRGANLEFILTVLKMRRRLNIEPQLILLSAVIGDTNGLERWLGARLLRRVERPVPLREGVLRKDGSCRYIDPTDGKEKIEAKINPEYRKGTAQDLVIPLVRKLVNEGKKVIIFRETKSESFWVANYLSEELDLPAAEETINLLPAEDMSRASSELIKFLQRGVGFHNADLDPEEREAIEQQFRKRDSSLKVISSTTTLAMGINTPAEAVIIVGLEHPGPEPKPYSVAEYKNIAGRAGRLGYSETGESFLIALNEHEENTFWTNYVQGQPEDLHSRIISNDTDPRSLVLGVLVSSQKILKRGLNREDILDFLHNSYGAFQRLQENGKWEWNREELQIATESLLSHRLITQVDDTYQITPLGRIAGEASLKIETVIRLIDVFRQISAAEINDAALITATQLSVELDQVNFPINKRSTQKEPQTWFNELRAQDVPDALLRGLNNHTTEEHERTLRAKKAFACLLAMTDRPLEEMEGILTQFGGSPGGAAGPLRALKSRTCDILPTVISIVEHLYEGLDLIERRIRLLVCLELCIPDTILEIARYTGDGLARRDYLRLIKNTVTKIADIDARSDEELLKLVNNDANKLQSLRLAAITDREEKSKIVGTFPILPPPK